MNESNDGGVCETALLSNLQPIRDLAKNWDIDLAACLDEYLQEICGNSLPPEDRQRIVEHHATNTNLNFAHAAVLLQNSSFIYSRKVEYLYALVYKALDELVASSNTISSQRKRHTGVANDPEIDEFFAFDPHQEYLLLDDVLPTADVEKINLPTDEHPSSPSNGRRNGKARQSWLSKSRLSLPMNDDTLMLDHYAIAPGQVDDPMPTTSVTGTFSLIGPSFVTGPDGLLRTPITREGIEPIETFNSISQSNAVDKNGGNADESLDRGNYDMGMDDDNDDGGYSFQMAEQSNNTPPPVVHDAVERNVPSDNDITKRLHRDATDPWALLDPHQTGQIKPKPLRVGKTVRLPPGLYVMPSDCVTGSRTSRVVRRQTQLPSLTVSNRHSIAVKTFQAIAARKRQYNELHQDNLEDCTEDATRENAGDENLVPLKGLAFGKEFSYIAQAYARRRAAERKEIRKKLQSNQQQPLRPVENIDLGEEDDEDTGNGYAFVGDDDNDDYGGDIPSDNGPVETNTGRISLDDLCRQHSDNGIEADSSPGKTPTFEDLCRAHIQAFAKGAEQYAFETNLSQRVAHWQQRLAPQLEEEEKRQVFDIHLYGAKVIHTMEDALKGMKLSDDIDEFESTPEFTGRNIVSFKSVTRDAPRHEVCRLFLAALSLSNMGNVNPIDVERNCESLHLELLETTIVRPMETYLAPSLCHADLGA